MHIGAMSGLALLFMATAQAGPAEELLLGYPRSQVEAVFPHLPADQLDLLVYRIPTFSQIMRNSGAHP